MPKVKCPKNYKDITGQKFGKLTVIKRNYPNGKGFRAMWLCKCDCGEEKIIRGDSIKSGMTKSCGCLIKEINKNNPPNIFRFGLANMRIAFKKYKDGARKRGLKFDLTEKQFEEITQRDCFYCGAEPSNIQNNKTCNGNFIYNGIDRTDNSKGYTLGNVVPCCYICNRRKGKSNLQEYKDWIERSYKNIFGKEGD